METNVYKFDLRAFQRDPNASAVSIGSLEPENMRQVPRNWPELAEKKQAQGLPLRHFYKGWRGKTNLGEMARKQACINFI